MAKPIVVIGHSGTGKTTSFFPNPLINIKGLPIEQTIVIQAEEKALPFPGWKKSFKRGKVKDGANLITSTSYTHLQACIKAISGKRPEIKYLIIDDSNYIMARPIMSDPDSMDWDEWRRLASAAYNSIANLEVRDDLTVFLVSHLDTDNQGREKMKTIGKMLDSYVYIDGLFTYILKASPRPKNDGTTEFRFLTKDGVKSTAKSPAGVFAKYIPNDMGLVIERIRAYEEDGIVVDDKGEVIDLEELQKKSK